jgi:hypothetical protein
MRIQLAAVGVLAVVAMTSACSSQGHCDGEGRNVRCVDTPVQPPQSYDSPLGLDQPLGG